MDNSSRDHLRPSVSREPFDEAPKWGFCSWKRLASACRPMAQAQNKGDLQQFLSETPKSLSRPLKPPVEYRVCMYGETLKVCEMQWDVPMLLMWHHQEKIISQLFWKRKKKSERSGRRLPLQRSTWSITARERNNSSGYRTTLQMSRHEHSHTILIRLFTKLRIITVNEAVTSRVYPGSDVPRMSWRFS